MYNFKINAKSFGSDLSALLRVLNSKNAILILDYFKLELINGNLWATAGDGENTVIMKIDPIASEGSGAICINAKKLTDTIKRLDGDVSVSVEENTVKIYTASGSYSMQGVDADSYPVSQNPEYVYHTQFATDSILKGINSVMFAVGTDDLRPQIMGVFMELGENEATFVATDTRVLAKCVESIKWEADRKSVIIPSKVAGIVSSLFAKESNISIGIAENKIEFSNDRVVLQATLLKGNYPDYNRVIPKGSSIKVRVNRRELINAIGRVMYFSDGNNLVVCDFNIGGVDIASKDVAMGQQASERIVCDSGAAIKIGFNGQYFNNVLNSMITEDVEIAMVDPCRPAVITPCGEIEVLALLMPMNIVE